MLEKNQRPNRFRLSAVLSAIFGMAALAPRETTVWTPKEPMTPERKARIAKVKAAAGARREAKAARWRRWRDNFRASQEALAR